MSQWIERKIWNDSNWLKHHSKMKIIDGIGRTFCAHEQWKGEETTLYKSIKIIFIINSSKKTMLYNYRKGYKKKNKQKKNHIRMASTIIILNRKVYHGIYSFEVL